MQDSLLFSPPSLPHGMLSSPQILQCLQAGLLVTDWDRKNLYSATYDMRMGNFACWYEGGLRINHSLGPVIDLNRGINTSLEFKPNSLTFVTTIEGFHLPCDIIARFNLRANWVRKGLLLGTAPIVEPQFTGRLLIPIHNFSSNPVQINFGEAFIAVEFTKTLPPDKEYVENANPEGNTDYYLERTGIVESSVYAAISRNEKLYADIQNKTKIFSIAGAITLFLLICSIMTLMLNIFNLADNIRKAALQAEKTITDFSGKNAVEFRKFGDELRELKFQIDKMREAGERK